MPADVQPLTWGSDPDKVPPTPLSEIKEALIGDEENIIGAIPDIGPVESATILDVSYNEPAVSLGDTDGSIPDIENTDIEYDLSNIPPDMVYSNLLSKYGESFITWEPETLKVVLYDDFDLETIPDNVWEAILATRVAGSGVAWEDYTAFEKAALAVSGSPVHPGKIQHVSVEEMSELFKLMQNISPSSELSDEVARYIAARMYTDQYLYAGSVFPDSVQGYIFELGASRALTDSVHEKVKNILIESKEGGKSLGVSIGELGTSEVDIQIARYISLL